MFGYQKNEQTSMGLYKNMWKKCRYTNVLPASAEIYQVYKTIYRELFVNSYSPLLDASYERWFYFCKCEHIAFEVFTGQNFALSAPHEYTEMPAYDAWMWMTLLPRYLAGEDISDLVEDALPYVCKGFSPKGSKIRMLTHALQKTDRLLCQRRQSLFEGAENPQDRFPKAVSSGGDVRKSTQAEDDELAAKVHGEAERVRRTAQEEAEEILRKAEADRETIIETAKNDAEVMIREAEGKAERKIADAKQRVMELTHGIRGEDFYAEQKQYSEGFDAIRQSLLEVNNKMKAMEEMVERAATKKAYGYLLELYNLIADTRDSTIQMAAETGNRDLENLAYNMEVYLDMISEYLAGYGIRTISTACGESFHGRYHSVQEKMDFEPRTAVVGQSLRDGFLWGEQVLQKERIILKEQEA